MKMSRVKKIIVAWIVLFNMLSYGSQDIDQHKDMPSLVQPNWLKKHLDDPKLVIIDVRKSTLYKKGHLRHAVNLPTFKKLFDEKLFMPKLDILKETFGKAGIDDNSLVVIYDNGDFIWAARCYWLLEVLGHQNVGLLTNSYEALKNQGFTLSSDDFIPTSRNFIPMINNTMIETKLSTLLSIDKKTIIDGRPKEYYDGIKSSAKRFGHIKSALSYPGSGNSKKTTTGSYILEIDKLAKLYQHLNKAKPIILYCMDGADAAMNYIILKQLGYKASVYEAGWLEWGNDTTLPIETPKGSI